MNNKSIVLNVISWIFGIVFFAIGVVNTFWGNDPGFGVFILLLSFVYFLPVRCNFQENDRFLNSWNGNNKNPLGHFYPLGIVRGR